MKVLVITEDHTLDQYIVRPVLQRVFTDLNRSLRVFFHDDPRMRGIDRVLNRDKIARVL